MTDKPWSPTPGQVKSFVDWWLSAYPVGGSGGKFPSDALHAARRILGVPALEGEIERLRASEKRLAEEIAAKAGWVPCKPPKGSTP